MSLAQCPGPSLKKAQHGIRLAKTGEGDTNKISVKSFLLKMTDWTYTKKFTLSQNPTKITLKRLSFRHKPLKTNVKMGEVTTAKKLETRKLRKIC